MGRSRRAVDRFNHERGAKMKPQISLKCPENIKNDVRDEQFGIKITNKTNDSIEFFLTGEIGDEFTQSDSASVARILSANRGKAVTMRVNSGGGLAFDGLAIYNALAQHDGPTTGIIEGLAASAASLAVIGADTVKMHANATFHIHEAIGIAIGHKQEMLDMVTWLESFNSAAAETYAAKTSKPAEYIAAAMLGEHGDGTKYNASEAYEIGFVDEVIPFKGKQKQRNDAGDKVNYVSARYRIAKLR